MAAGNEKKLRSVSTEDRDLSLPCRMTPRKQTKTRPFAAGGSVTAVPSDPEKVRRFASKLYFAAGYGGIAGRFLLYSTDSAGAGGSMIHIFPLKKCASEHFFVGINAAKPVYSLEKT